eukprot:3933021-Rhodomonas_salina.1
MFCIETGYQWHGGQRKQAPLANLMVNACPSQTVGGGTSRREKGLWEEETDIPRGSRGNFKTSEEVSCWCSSSGT